MCDDELAAADRLARRSAAAMLDADQAIAALGIELIDVSGGRARMRMTVRADMVNGHGVVHGGLVFALADSAFAVVCNSYGLVTLAAGADITFIAPARLGDVLVADAVQTDTFGRSGLTDVRINRESADELDGDALGAKVSVSNVVAVFRGRSRSLGRPIPGITLED